MSEIIQKISYNTKQLSEVTGLSCQQIRRLVKQGKLPAYTPTGRRQLYFVEDVQKLIKESVKIN